MIEVHNVTKRFGDFTALDDVSLDGARRLADRAARPERPRQVDAAARHRRARGARRRRSSCINGEDATHLPAQERGVGFVFQHYAAFKHMTVRDNVAFGLTIRKRPKDEIAERVDELLELVQPRRLRTSATRRSCPAASASAWRSPARSRAAARAAARRAVRRARRQRPRGAARVAAPPARRGPRDDRSSSRTTRRRRWRSPSRSWSSTTAASSRSARRASSTTRRPTSSSWASSARSPRRRAARAPARPRALDEPDGRRARGDGRARRCTSASRSASSSSLADGGERVTAQLTRAEAEELELAGRATSSGSASPTRSASAP